jgi:glycosyltransferase involved in cell wall biosynthesis
MDTLTTAGIAPSPLRDELTLLPQRCDISLVIPVYEEQENVGKLHDELSQVLASLPITAEMIFVDDGSRDKTLQELEQIFANDPRTRVISLRRNFGKTAALLAGFQEAKGEIVVTMDGDLQDDPAELPRFLQAISGGYDLVSGWKQKRNDPISKTVPSRFFNGVVSRSTGIPLHDFNCGFKAYRREVLEELKLYGELHRFIPVLAYWRGFRVGEIAVHHRARQYGRSKFGAARLFKGLLDFVMVMFLTRYMQRPLQLFGVLGLGVFAAGAAGFIYLLILKLIGQSIFRTHGPLLFLSGIMIVSGILLFMLGLVGEMLRHYGFQPRDEYSVKRRLARD